MDLIKCILGTQMFLELTVARTAIEWSGPPFGAHGRMALAHVEWPCWSSNINNLGNLSI